MGALGLLLCLMFVAGVHGARTYDPLPDPAAVVVAGNARFTVLTSSLLRLEWNAERAFVDAPTLAFVNRRLPVPAFSVTHGNDGWLVVTTATVELRYYERNNTSFDADNLRVGFVLSADAGTRAEWYPGLVDQQNLKGTVRTLDGINGFVNLDCDTQARHELHCSYAVISRSGFAVVDDTLAAQFDQSFSPAWLTLNRDLPTPTQCSAAGTARVSCGNAGTSQFECTRRGCCNGDPRDGLPLCFMPDDGSAITRDWYFFGHGLNYKQALKDFTLVSGDIPLPPRFAFGVWFSRYWAYSDVEQKEIVDTYATWGIPLDVLVTDMDWHITYYRAAQAGERDPAGETPGWTGYTWDRHLFPAPEAFLDWCEARNIRNTLNLHPASGIQPHEEQYEAMARAVGIDPATRQFVPFEPLNQTFVNAWFDIVLNPLGKIGVDFWWLDWQQGETWLEDEEPAINPTFWLNYLFWSRTSFWGEDRRPLIFHRWGGLGNHRYQIGFSGDTFATWSALQFQPYFTLTASNIGYTYWSHDIGGHNSPAPTGELYTRWVQFGIFSPIYRSHTTKDALSTRDIWMYEYKYFNTMRRAMVLRSELVPYIYTASRLTYDTALGIIRPMYYESPDQEEAYAFRTQYYFGEDMIVSPVVDPVDEITQLALKSITSAPFGWYEWHSGKLFASGPLTVDRYVALDEIPVFVRAGAIVPMMPSAAGRSVQGAASTLPDPLRLLVFPGATSGSGQLYEDDGVSSSYDTLNAWTRFAFGLSGNGRGVSFTIFPVVGSFGGMPTQRRYEIHLLGSYPASSVALNGTTLPFWLFGSSRPQPAEYWTYDGEALALIVHLGTPLSTATATSLQISLPGDARDSVLTSGVIGRLRRLHQVKKLLDNQWKVQTVYQEDYVNVLDAASIGQRLTASPSSAAAELSRFDAIYSAGVTEVEVMPGLNEDIRKQALAMLLQY